MKEKMEEFEKEFSKKLRFEFIYVAGKKTAQFIILLVCPFSWFQQLVSLVQRLTCPMSLSVRRLRLSNLSAVLQA